MRVLASLMLLSLSLGASPAIADSPGAAGSEIAGVRLWLLDDASTERFVDSVDPFVRHCDGSRTVYVGGIESPLACRSARTPDGSYAIHLDGKGRSLPRPVLVSMKPLAGRFTPPAPDAQELVAWEAAENAVRGPLAQAARNDYLATYGVQAADYERMAAALRATPAYRARANRRWKLPAPDGAIFISSIDLRPDPQGWNLENVVFRAEHGHLVEAGRFDGCIQGLRDLDGDGVPEVYAETCANDEGIAYEFWSVFPAVRRMVSH